jgi:phosphoribulokinase
VVQKAIWSQLQGDGGDPPDTLGNLGGGERSEPLAITQLLLLYHLLEASP